MREISDPGRPAPAADPESIETLQAALAAERARTRDVDHRAKNTLQLVSSLLLLASRRNAGPETRRALEAMHLRVCALAAVHRDLPAAASPDRFNLTQLVRDQATALARTCGGAVVQLDLDPVEVDASAACPLALILNELAVNAFTHAGRDGRPPSVGVRLQRAGASAGFTLAVTDDGPGPEAARPAGFGLTLVELFSQQIAARFVMEDAQPGLRAIVLAP